MGMKILSSSGIHTHTHSKSLEGIKRSRCNLSSECYRLLDFIYIYIWFHALQHRTDGMITKAPGVCNQGFLCACFLQTRSAQRVTSTLVRCRGDLCWDLTFRNHMLCTCLGLGELGLQMAVIGEHVHKILVKRKDLK